MFKEFYISNPLYASQFYHSETWMCENTKKGAALLQAFWSQLFVDGEFGYLIVLIVQGCLIWVLSLCFRLHVAGYQLPVARDQAGFAAIGYKIMVSS